MAELFVDINRHHDCNYLVDDDHQHHHPHQAKEKEERAKIPPSEMFLSQRGVLYSRFDETGLPTHDKVQHVLLIVMTMMEMMTMLEMMIDKSMISS